MARRQGARDPCARDHRLHRALQGARAPGGATAARITPYAAISPHVKRAVLGAEDINFFSHGGFDWGEIRSAVEDALDDKKEAAREASTITQQLAKNLWLSPSRNPLRKVKEAILTWQLERSLSKWRIFEIYLNVVELGPAAERYFGKPAADLGEDEAALLAASLPRPSQWHPGITSRAYQRYVLSIRERMDRAEFLWKQI